MKKKIILAVSIIVLYTINTVVGQDNVKTFGGTINFIPKWSNYTQIINSKIYEDSIGNVGFGTNTPQNNFQLHNPNADIINSGWTIFQMTNEGTGRTINDGLIIKIGANGFSKNAVLMNTEIGTLSFGTNNQSRLSISNDGIVVIGDNFLNTNSKFQVDGGSTFNGPITVENSSFLKGNVVVQNTLGVGINYPAIEKLEVNGAIKLYQKDKYIADNGTIIWNGTDFFGQKNGNWVSLTSENSPNFWQLFDNGIYTDNFNVGINTIPQTSLHIKNINTKEPSTIRLETVINDGDDPIITDIINAYEGFKINHQDKDVLTLNSTTAILNNQLIINRPDANTPDISITKNGNDYFPCIHLENSYENGGGTNGENIINTAFDIYNQNGALNFKANNGSSIIAIHPQQIIFSRDLSIFGNIGLNTAPSSAAALTAKGDITVMDNSNHTNIKIYSNGKMWIKNDIKIQEINEWGDFVFDENYKLKSLKELEIYINTNKHLPGLPSTKEVETNGINLGEMTNTLTQKLEELTLYIIEQNKKIEALQKEIIELKK